MNITTVLEIALFCLTLGLIFYIQINRKILNILLKHLKIYLPFIEQDFDLLNKIKEENKQDRQAIVRSCDFNEYIQATEEDTYYEFDMLFFFLLTCILSIFFLFIKNLILVYLTNQLVYDDALNISNSFLLITIGYICFIVVKKIMNQSLLLYSQLKQFILIFIISVLSFNALETFIPDLLNIQYTLISKQILSYINTKLHLNPINLDTNQINETNDIITHHQNKIIIQIVFSIIFGFITSITTVSGQKIYIFDLCIMNNYYRGEVMKTIQLASYESIDSKIKLKIVLNIMILFNLIDILSKSLILNHKYIYSICLLLVAGTELCLNIKAILFSFMIFHHKNYIEAIDFCSHGKKEDLIQLKKTMDEHNRKFWEVAFMFFVHCFMPLILILFYLNNSLLIEDLIGRIIFGNNKGHWDFKQGFIEGIVYVMLFAFSFAKAIILNSCLIKKIGILDQWNISKIHF